MIIHASTLFRQNKVSIFIGTLKYLQNYKYSNIRSVILDKVSRWYINDFCCIIFILGGQSFLSIHRCFKDPVQSDTLCHYNTSGRTTGSVFSAPTNDRQVGVRTVIITLESGKTVTTAIGQAQNQQDSGTSNITK